MSLFLLLNPKQFNVVGGHFPTVYVPLWTKKKRKPKKRDLKRIMLSYLRREVPAEKVPQEVIERVAYALNASETRIKRDWNALIQARKSAEVRRRDDELIALFFVSGL